MSVAELTEFDASETGGAQLVRGENGEEDSEDAKDLEGWVAQGVTANGVPVQWYRHFGTAVPPPPSPPSAGYAEEPFVIVLANEYFDALPARQFQLTDRGWCEVCVDVADEAEELMDGQPPSPYHLKWTLSPQESPAVAGNYASNPHHNDCDQQTSLRDCLWLQRTCRLFSRGSGSA